MAVSRAVGALCCADELGFTGHFPLARRVELKPDRLLILPRHIVQAGAGSSASGRIPTRLEPARKGSGGGPAQRRELLHGRSCTKGLLPHGERRRQRRHPQYSKPELLATGPNQCWSWDITKLKGPVKWSYFYL